MIRFDYWETGRRLLLGSVIATALSSLALGARPEAPLAGESAQVRIASFRFDPETLVVAPGTTVTWLNEDEEIHTITSSDGLFTSSALEDAESFSRVYSTPGTFEYHCALHPQMNGKVIVR